MMAILVSLLLLSNLAATNGITFVVLAASCLWLAVYVLIHAAVLILRKRYPEIKRSRRLTLFGIPQIIGAIGDIYMIVFISTGADREEYPPHFSEERYLPLLLRAQPVVPPFPWDFLPCFWFRKNLCSLFFYPYKVSFLFGSGLST